MSGFNPENPGKPFIIFDFNPPQKPHDYLNQNITGKYDGSSDIYIYFTLLHTMYN
jgi:hypothetical protein